MINQRRPAGFSIPELIVSIVVLGILVTISSVGYSVYTANLHKKAVEHDLKAAAASMETVKNFSEGYPLEIPADFTPGEKIVVEYEWGSLSTFCLSGYYETDEEDVYHIENGGEVEEGGCGDEPV